jgi:HEAT repeat protein
MTRCAIVVPSLVLVLSAIPAKAYVDMAPTLGTILREATAVALIEVDRFSIERGALLLKKVRDLKGEVGASPVKHQVLRGDETRVEETIRDWAEPGRRGVLFVSGKSALVCMGQGWYQVYAGAEGWWRLGAPRPDLALAYYGGVARLTDAVTQMIDGRTAIITTLPHGADKEGASFDLALERTRLPDLVKIQRLRAHLRMPGVVMAVSANPAYLVGPGPAGEDEIPSLRKRLADADTTVRAEAANDLGSLGAKAAGASPDLTKLLGDAPEVRTAAAAALLRIEPDHASALDTLAQGLASDDVETRRHAARSIGKAGTAAAPLVVKLAALLGDRDLVVRRAALQAIATLGATAESAVEPVARLLENPETMLGAAEALGRIGPAARPAMKDLASLLKAAAAATRWAGVRAMVQIGGDGAGPAVDFIRRELASASELDSYNMLIYLALLGPNAKDAVPAIRTSRVKNPILRQATAWAIEPESRFPFVMPMGDAEFARYIFESYLRELRDGLRPAAAMMARRIMDGTAGELPPWAYALLAKHPKDVIPLLMPGLTSDELVKRERAAVALGYMGPVAAAARDEVCKAVERAPGEQERRLLAWTLRQIDRSR